MRDFHDRYDPDAEVIQFGKRRNEPRLIWKGRGENTATIHFMGDVDHRYPIRPAVIEVTFDANGVEHRYIRRYALWVGRATRRVVCFANRCWSASISRKISWYSRRGSNQVPSASVEKVWMAKT